jgi:hypothetical protein
MNIPNIDFFGKLITFIGLAGCIATGFFVFREYIKIGETFQQLQQNGIIITNTTNKFKAAQSDYIIENEKIDSQKNIIISSLGNAKNDIKFLNSQLEILQQDKEANRLKFNSVIPIYNSFIDSATNNYNIQNAVFSKRMENYSLDFDTATMGLIISIFILSVGITLWIKKERFDNELIYRQNLDKPTFSQFCQSCGKTFNSLIVPSLEQDGTKNYHYCNKCYSNGTFIEPTLSLTEMKSRTKAEMESTKQSKKNIEKVLKRIEKLDRWKKDLYEGLLQ